MTDLTDKVFGLTPAQERQIARSKEPLAPKEMLEAPDTLSLRLYLINKAVFDNPDATIYHFRKVVPDRPRRNYH